MSSENQWRGREQSARILSPDSHTQEWVPKDGPNCQPGGGGGGGETLYHYHRDDALLYIAYVMLNWAAPIPVDRWHCSLWP